MSRKTDYSRLNEMLLAMEKAAATGSRGLVETLNQKYSPLYAKIAPRNYEKGSFADLYDRARNKILNSVDDIVAPTKEDKKEELKEAREIRIKIEKLFGHLYL